jgi:hypothetical protein
MSELKPCPFCGGAAYQCGHNGDTIACVECGGGTGPCSDAPSAVVSWNCRTLDYRALAQELATALEQVDLDRLIMAVDKIDIMSEMQEALERYHVAIRLLGGIDMKTGKSLTIMDIHSARDAILALYDARTKLTQELAAFAKSASYRIFGETFPSHPEYQACEAILAKIEKAGLL